MVMKLYSEALDDSLAQKENQLFSYEQSLRQKKVEHEFNLKNFEFEKANLERALSSAQKEYDKTAELFKAALVSADEMSNTETKKKNAEDALLKQSLVVQQEALQYDLAVETLTNSIATTKKDIASLKGKIASLTVVSPSSGIIVTRNFSVGYNVNQYAELATVADTSRILARLDVPETQVGMLTKGMEVLLEINSRTYTGVIDRISPIADTSSSNTAATVKTFVRLTGSSAYVPQGSSVTATIPLATNKAALVLPRGAYLVSGSYASVYVVRGNKAYKTAVTFGIITDTSVEVKSGLQKGDKIIISGYQEFIDKSTIELARKE
jgi:RND family efflux transporter MFP subunit